MKLNHGWMVILRVLPSDNLTTLIQMYENVSTTLIKDDFLGFVFSTALENQHSVSSPRSCLNAVQLPSNWLIGSPSVQSDAQDGGSFASEKFV